MALPFANCDDTNAEESRKFTLELHEDPGVRMVPMYYFITKFTPILNQSRCVLHRLCEVVKEVYEYFRKSQRMGDIHITLTSSCAKGPA